MRVGKKEIGIVYIIKPQDLIKCDWICTSYCRINTPKKQGGLGPMNIPLVSDPKRTIAQDYGVLKADEGISFRYASSPLLGGLEFIRIV